MRQSGVTGINRRNVDLVYHYNKVEHHKLADDKVLTKTYLNQADLACAETYGVIRKSMEIDTIWSQCRLKDSLAIKPAQGSGGGGIMVLRKNELGQWQKGDKVVSEKNIRHHIGCILSGMFSKSDQDHCLIEACIVPHPFFATIFPGGVPDFRIITLKGRPLMAMLRMPTSKSDGMANLHQGGVGIGIDMETGRLTQVFDGKSYSSQHPDQGSPVTGLEIPEWNKMYRLAIDTAREFPLDYLGIDLVLDESKGPMVMEINVRPGLAIQLVNQLGISECIMSKERIMDSGKTAPTNVPAPIFITQ